MTLLCPLCLSASFTCEESLLYELISSATRKISCPTCSEILYGFDKFTVHLCSHILKCDSNPVTLKINDSMIKINKQLESIHLQRNYEKTVNLCSPVPTVDTLRVESNISNTIAVSNDHDKTAKEVPFGPNYLVQCAVEPEVNDETLSNCEPKNPNEFGDFSLNYVWPVQSITDDFQSAETPSLPTYNNLVKQLQNDLSEISRTTSDSKLNILHVDFFNEDVPVTVISNDDKSIEQQDVCESGCTKCKFCAASFPNSVLLKLHIELVHGENNKNKSNAKFQFQCKYCQKKFKIKGSLLIHQQVAHRLLCDESIPSLDTLHSDEEKKKQYFCNICFKFFKKEHYLHQHLKVHDEKQWSCDECGKSFTTKYFLKKHKRLHTGEMPYSCSICDKHFTFQQSYHRHMMYHNAEKPYSCEECGRSFKELSTLYNHQRIHTGEKPYSCDICGKNFRQRVSCLIHSRIHTGSKPYKCSQCQKLFRYKMSLKSHKCLQTNNMQE